MSHSSTRLIAIRILFLAGIIQGLTLACDTTGPTGPNAGSELAVPNSPMYGLVPGGFSATGVAWNQVSLSWSAVPSATGYQLFRSTTGATGDYVPLTGTLAATRYVDGGLTGATQYCYEVRSTKTAGKNISYSALSSPACATTLPPPVAAPSETDAAPQGYNALVKWKDNSDNETGFHIQTAPLSSESWVNAVDAPANATSALVYVPIEQPTCFRVIAFNTSGPSNPSTPDCTTRPAAPTNLSATITAPQTINLAWTDNSAFEDGYRVSRSANFGAWIDIASLPANALTYQDASAAPDVNYRYVVMALKDGGFSDGSNQVTVFVATTVPAAPAGTSAAWYPDTEGYGWNYLVIWWADLSNNEAGFRVEYSADGNTGWTLYATTGIDETYLQQQFSVYDGVPPGGCYRVIAFNNIGDSNASDIACVEPGVIVTDLSAAAVDQQEIDLTWSDVSAIETTYAVLRSTEAYGTYEVIGTASPGATTYQDKNLASGQEYWYMIAAVYPGGGWGEYSNMASATTAAQGGVANRVSGTVLSPPTSRTAIRVRGVRLPTPPNRDTKTPGMKK